MKEKIGKRIRKLRVQKGFSQEEVAEKLHISRSAYERMETGKSNTWASQLENLSGLFEVTPEYFVQGEKNVQHNEKQNGGMSLQNNGKIKNLNNLSDEKLIEQFQLRLKEKDELIEVLRKDTTGKQ